MVEFNVFNVPYFKAQNIRIEQLKDFNSPVCSLAFNGSYTSKTEQRDLVAKYNDDEHGIVYIEQILDDIGTLSFDRDFYLRNKEEIDKQILRILSTTKSDSIRLEKEFISEDFVRAISQNTNIKTVYLGSNNDKYTLTKDIYDILFNSSIEEIHSADSSLELRDVFGGKIYCNDNRTLVAGYKYNTLIKSSEIVIRRVLADEELKYLKYVNSDCTVRFTRIIDFDNFLKVIKVLENKPNVTIKIELRTKEGYSCKNEFNTIIDKHPELLRRNILVKVEGEDYDIRDYSNYENKLNALIKDAYGLSPFERYLYAYNVVKKFRKYEENDNDKMEARDLYKILKKDNKSIVCHGYAVLLHDLLEKLGIESEVFSVSVETGFKKVPIDVEVTPDGVETGRAGHSRVRVHIVDPKYDIDGIYFADPTWDNNMNNDAYNHALMTQEEYLMSRRFIFFKRNNIEDVFYSKTIDEFYIKANFWMSSRIRIEKSNYEDRISLSYENELSEIYMEYMTVLKDFDENEYNNVNLLFRNLKNTKYIPSNAKDFEKREKKYLEKHNNPQLQQLLNQVEKTIIDFNNSRAEYLKTSSTVSKFFIKDMISSLKYIDRKKYHYFKEKYKDVYEKEFVPDDDYVSEAMLEFGEYVVINMNSEVSGEKFKEAITELYSKCYGVPDDKLEETVNAVMFFNKKRQELFFPSRYKITGNSKEPYSNQSNKFDIDNMDFDI